MDFTTDVVFLGLVALVAMIVAEVVKAAAKAWMPGFIWPRLNGVTIANVVGALIVGPTYYALWPQLHAGAAQPGELYAFVMAGWMAGWTAAGMRSTVKDVSDGSLGATTPADVAEMRMKNDSKGGIGG